MDYSTMPAGRELDALVAEKVMGLSAEDAYGTFNYQLPDADGRKVPIPKPYSTSISAAWEVWEKVVRDIPGSWAIYSEGPNEVTVEHYSEDYVGDREASCGNDIGEDGPFPLAICRAALLAGKE